MGAVVSVTWREIAPFDYDDGRKRRRGACERLWQGYGEARQEEIYQRIEGKLARGEFVNENPYFAIEDNAKQPKKRVEMMSFNDYYVKFGTTEEKDGWKQANPTGNKVIYVKGETG